MSRFVPLHEEIFLGSAASPDSTAIIYQDECISFNGLNQFSSNLAWHLQELGIGSGSLVGIYLQPSANLAISILAVLKSGAAYIPLSQNFPEERIRFILQDANAELVITDNSLAPAPVFGQTQSYIPDWQKVKSPDEKRLPRNILVKASDLAYILYTSGSTGNPKGVMIEHRNLNYYVHWFCQWVMPETKVGLPLTSSFIFAAAVSQFYTTLVSGKTLHILDPLMIRQPGKLIGWYATHPEVGLYCVPTLWSEILHYLETTDDVFDIKSAPTCVYLSGEAVTDDLLKRSFSLLPDLQLWNLYGPTEATANLTACRLFPGETASIGKPIAGTRVFIVGDDLNPVERGATGELIASGEGIAKGYVNLPELNETTFFSSKPDGEESIRMYRSGDLVKEDGSGRLIFVGRKDQQVKIRGFRIELPEIEHAILAIPDVKQAVVQVVEERKNGKRLAAYLVYRQGFQMPVNELRKILSQTLPDFMVPEVFVHLDQLPQLPNGKIDRKSLPLPGIQRPDLGYPLVPPSVPDEKMMVRVWEEVLGLEGIGLQDNFFDLGGNSLKANEIVLELNAKSGVSIQIKDVFDRPTPANLVKHPAFASANLQVEMPENDLSDNNIPEGLSENQKALLFMQQADPGLAAYNIFYCLSLSGNLDLSALENALLQILDKHKTLKTKFPVKNKQNKGFETVLDNKVLGIYKPGTDNLPASSEEAIEHARNAASLPFDLEEGSPYRFILYKLEGSQHLLAFIVHHIVFDGFSFDIFLKELATFYDQEKNGQVHGPIVSSPSFAHFCQEEHQYLSSQQYKEDRQYWQQQLSQVPAFFEIPTDFARPDFHSQEGGQVRRTINPLLRRKLKNLGDHLGTSMFMTCMAAFTVLLHRHTGRTDFLIGTPVANRAKKSFMTMIGYFVNTMLFRATLERDLSFKDWLLSVRDTTLENLTHSKFPFNRLGEVLKTERIPGINPFFQVMFAYHETSWEFTTDAGLSGVAAEGFFGCSKFDLFTEIFDRHNDTEIVLTFSSHLYHPATMDILLDHFVQILEHICSAPETKINALNLLSPAEFDQTIYKWNQTAFALPGKGSITDLIERQIGATPDLPALVSRHEVISYREMGRRTDIIAANLRSRGVKKGVPVGIHLENSPNLVMCILAVFKAGGIYIPLDPYYPEERLRYVIEKTKLQYLVVDEGRLDAKRELSQNILPIDELLEQPFHEAQAAADGQNSPTDIAYIIFTSGSTGNPKGVMVCHHSFLNVLLWIKMELDISTADTFLCTSSINFDISLTELFAPLISGASLVLEKRSGLQAPELVEAIMDEMQVNMVQFVPSGLKVLCDAGVIRRAKNLKCIISTGEKLSKPFQEQIFGEFKGILINLYGPTEATVYMAFWHCLRNSPLRMVPIGTPVFNASFYILDEKMKPLPIGIAGEIFIGGDVLAQGYFEDTEQTATRFLPNPFIQGNGNRIYKTGDLGRFLWNGSVEFLGRTDHQVKVRGFRIELGEVESVILRFPGIRNVVVDAREQNQEDIRLTAYMVPEPNASFRENELRDFLRLHLPAYMIPGHFIIAPAIPALPNGKTDFKSLMSLRPQIPQIPDFNYQQIDETEMSLIELWREVLEHEAFTTNDNFFEVGGHSLLLAKLKELIAEKLNEEVSIVDLFHYPTIKTLSAFLRKDKPAHPFTDVAKRVAMRNRNIRQQASRRIFPDNKQS